MPTTLPRFTATRVISARRGSSWPVLVQTESGRFLTKLRGAAQGVPPLVAEIIVGELSTVLGLPVPDRALVELAPETPTDDSRDELLDLLARSAGENLGFRFLPEATDLKTNQLDRIEPDMAARIVWLDGLVMNPDRTAHNPNILLWRGRPWLIDHGAALSFHYDWSHVSEDSPREPGFDVGAHLLIERVSHLHLGEVDRECTNRLDRVTLERACTIVPDSLLHAAFPGEEPVRIRAAYVAFLWKRLKAPRPFWV